MLRSIVSLRGADFPGELHKGTPLEEVLFCLLGSAINFYVISLGPSSIC